MSQAAYQTATLLELEAGDLYSVFRFTIVGTRSSIWYGFLLALIAVELSPAGCEGACAQKRVLRSPQSPLAAATIRDARFESVSERPAAHHPRRRLRVRRGSAMPRSRSRAWCKSAIEKHINSIFGKLGLAGAQASASGSRLH